MTIYSSDFKPTYLYIKQHNITGKLYFGKTIRDPEKYQGSGKHWKLHINKHGKEHIVTLWYCLFLYQEECTEFASIFSKQQNIVDSVNWLNLKDENGKDGGASGRWTMSEEGRMKISMARRGKSMTGKASKGHTKSVSHKEKIRMSLIGKPHKGYTPSDEVKIKISMSLTGRPHSEERKKNIKEGMNRNKPSSILPVSVQ